MRQQTWRWALASVASAATMLLHGAIVAPGQAQSGASDLQNTNSVQRCASTSGQAQLEACRQALEEAPERPDLWFFFGQALSDLDRHAAAARAYEQAANVVRVRRDAAISGLPGYQQTVAPFLRDILRFEGQRCAAAVRAQRQQMTGILNDADGIRQLEAAINSGQVEGEELARLREMRAEIERFQDNPAALDARMQNALATCRRRTQEALEQVNAAE